MRHLSLFTGVGGGDLAHQHLLGWTTVGYVEFDKFCQQVLAQRIEDGFLQEAPIFGDIDGFIESGASKKYKGYIDVVTAGFPCQGHSVAGRRLGKDDPRNKWPQTLAVIRDLRPRLRYAFLENVAGLLSVNGGAMFAQILADLAEAGMDARWIVLGADDVGAPHRRKRLWILADSNGDDGWTGSGTVAPGRRSRLEHRSGSAGQSVGRPGEDVADSDSPRELQPEWSEQNERRRSGDSSEDVADSDSPGLQQSNKAMAGGSPEQPDCSGIQPGEDVSDPNDPRLQGWVQDGEPDTARRQIESDGRSAECSSGWEGSGNKHWPTEPQLGRVANGVANRVDRLKAIGNGQVSRVAATAWRLLNESYPKKP